MRQGTACMHASVHVCVSVRVHTYGDWVGRGVGVPNLHIWKCFFSPRRLLCCGQMELESAQKPWRQTHQKKKKKREGGQTEGSKQEEQSWSRQRKDKLLLLVFTLLIFCLQEQTWKREKQNCPFCWKPLQMHTLRKSKWNHWSGNKLICLFKFGVGRGHCYFCVTNKVLNILLAQDQLWAWTTCLITQW